MKTQLIILNSEQGIIVSDKEIKEGDWIFDNYCKINLIQQVRRCDLDSSHNRYGNWKKIIAGIPKLPSINYNNLEEQFGIVDVEELAENYARKQCEDLYSKIGIAGHSWGWETAFDFKEGFKATQQLNDKKFSEYDMREALLAFISEVSCIDGSLVEKNPADAVIWVDNYIESLSKPKVFDIEIEMEVWNVKGNVTSLSKIEPKVTNNQIKIIKVL